MNNQQQTHAEDEGSLSHAPPQATQSTAEAHLSAVAQEVPLVMEHALIRCLAMLQQYNLASSEDCSQVAAKVRRCWESGKGADAIDCLARLRAGGGEMLDASVEMISVKMANSLPFVPTRVPFAGRLIPPAGFYEKHPDIALLCKLLQVPVVFAEDEDVFGLASINPYFADALESCICEKLKKKNGIKPIISVIRLDYISWSKMCQKHFREVVKA